MLVSGANELENVIFITKGVAALKFIGNDGSPSYIRYLDPSGDTLEFEEFYNIGMLQVYVPIENIDGAYIETRIRRWD